MMTAPGLALVILGSALGFVLVVGVSVAAAHAIADLVRGLFMSDAAPPTLKPTHEGTWWRTYQDLKGGWSWMTFEVWEWDDGKGLRTRQGPISGTPDVCKWGGEAVPPDLDPSPPLAPAR